MGGPRLMPGSQHFWWVRLGQCANVMVGVAVDSCMLLDTHEERRAWFYYCSTGDKYQAGQSSAYGGKCEAGDVVGVFYDADAHTISFYKNALCLGPAFSGLPPNMRPAVSLHNLNSEVTVDFGSYDLLQLHLWARPVRELQSSLAVHRGWSRCSDRQARSTPQRQRGNPRRSRLTRSSRKSTTLILRVLR